MHIVLTTPLSLGDLDPTSYTHAKIKRVHSFSLDSHMAFELCYGRIVDGAWIDAPLLDGCTFKHYTIYNKSSPVWEASTNYRVGDVRRHGGNTYVCVQAGKSGLDGPSGTAQAVVDDTTTWKCDGPEAEYDAALKRAAIDSNESVVDILHRGLYQWLIDSGKVVGTIAT